MIAGANVDMNSRLNVCAKEIQNQCRADKSKSEIYWEWFERTSHSILRRRLDAETSTKARVLIPLLDAGVDQYQRRLAWLGTDGDIQTTGFSANSYGWRRRNCGDEYEADAAARCRRRRWCHYGGFWLARVQVTSRTLWTSVDSVQSPLQFNQ